MQTICWSQGTEDSVPAVSLCDLDYANICKPFFLPNTFILRHLFWSFSCRFPVTDQVSEVCGACWLCVFLSPYLTYGRAHQYFKVKLVAISFHGLVARPGF